LAAARSLARTLALRRSAAMATTRSTGITGTTQFRSVQTVPKIGTEAEMQAEAIEQVRARIAYQKEVMAANPHKSHDEEWTELWLWIKISIFVAGPGCFLMMGKDALIEEHHHRPDGPFPEYMNIRSKEFPWECDQCPLFDLDCWKKCRAEKTA
jgi:cytochrome c oxidase subunit 6a